MESREANRTGMKHQDKLHILPLDGLPVLPGVRFFFTTRVGGVSKGSYRGFNLGLHVGDHPGKVIHNRALLLDRLGPLAERLCLVNQVHGRQSVEAAQWPAGPPDADALVTRRSGLVLGILTADCVPVLLADTSSRVIGAVHAGWRGALAGVVESCLADMVHLGAHAERITAIVGPCIRAPHYPVDIDFRDRFLTDASNKVDLDCQKFFSQPSKIGKVQFDLPGYVQAHMIFSGITKERIWDVELCTARMANTFFSHRRATTLGTVSCGRQMGGIYLV